ncbi:MAG: DUF3106 domain-containing protein [Planctomycetes bacterium]|nr:DUF3106 domain-containing protein [Planctomycetota bacterium]
MARLHILLLLVLAALVGGRASAGDGRLEAARERWERLSPAEQARVRERYERLRAMPEQDRASLQERARWFAEAIRRVEENLPAETRERLARLDPLLRRELVRDLAIADGGERIARMSGAGPEAWRAKLESLPSTERERLLREMKQRGREHGRGRLGELLQRKHGLPQAEVERILSLPEAERWEALRKLRGEEEARRPRPDDAQSLARRRAFEAARPHAADHLRYAELTPGERRELVARIARQRVVSVLREAGLATDAEIAALDQLSHDEFRRALHERCAPPHGRGGGRGPHHER